MKIEPIAHIRSPYAEKFGVPRQSGLAPHVQASVVFSPSITQDYVRGLETFSHIWLIWGFHCVTEESVHATVRPPRLGGNTRIGVFASRSPFRPNPIGLSAVRLLAVEPGPVLRVAGADLVDGTPVYDIKPYLPYADCIEGASSGFVDSAPRELLSVELPESMPQGLPPEYREALCESLAQDPRPAYQDDPERVYHMILRPCELDFVVSGGVLRVTSIRRLP